MACSLAENSFFLFSSKSLIKMLYGIGLGYYTCIYNKYCFEVIKEARENSGKVHLQPNDNSSHCSRQLMHWFAKSVLGKWVNVFAGFSRWFFRQIARCRSDGYIFFPCQKGLLYVVAHLLIVCFCGWPLWSRNHPWKDQVTDARCALNPHKSQRKTQLLRKKCPDVVSLIFLQCWTQCFKANQKVNKISN